MDDVFRDDLMAARWLVLCGAVGLASALVGCTRSSAPAPTPTSTSVAQTPPSVSLAGPTPGTMPTSSSAPLPSGEPPLGSAPAESVAAPASSPRAADDCARLEASAAYRDLPAEARARSLATCRAKEEFRAFVAARQSCSSATQCTIVVGSCPFGCFVPVAKTSSADVVAKLETLGADLDKAGNRCVYRCMSPPAGACVAGRCSAGTP